MTRYTLNLPDDLEALYVTSKGWLCGVELLIDDQTYMLTFYDPVRLSQTIADVLPGSPLFFEANLIVVPVVTRDAMERAVEQLACAGEHRWLVPETPTT